MCLHSKSLKERQNSSKAGQRRLRNESFSQPNIPNLRTANENPELVDALMKYGKNPYNWNPVNYAIEMRDYKAALVLLSFSENSDVRDGNRLPLDRLLLQIQKNRSISISQEALLKKMFILGFKNDSDIGSKEIIFYSVAEFGKLFFIDWLLDHHVDLNANN